MGTRRVITPDDIPDKPSSRLRPRRTPDGYKTRLLKYIPADVVAAWVFLDGILTADPKTPWMLHWTVFATVLVLTPLWTWYTAYEPDLPVPPHQVISSTIAFIVWAFALGGPFEALSWYTVSLASVLLALYTLTAPLIPFLLDRWSQRSDKPSGGSDDLA